MPRRAEQHYEVARIADIKRGIDVANRKLERSKLAKCDWKDPEEVAMYQSERNLQARMKYIYELAPKLHCPLCGRGPLIASTEWIVNVHQDSAMCRRCFHTLRNYTPNNNVDLSKDEMFSLLFRFANISYYVDGHRLRMLRAFYGVNAAQLADKCGWSAAYQSSIEAGNTATLKHDKVLLILESLLEIKRRIRARMDIFRANNPDVVMFEQELEPIDTDPSLLLLLEQPIDLPSGIVEEKESDASST